MYKRQHIKGSITILYTLINVTFPKADVLKKWTQTVQTRKFMAPFLSTADSSEVGKILETVITIMPFTAVNFCLLKAVTTTGHQMTVRANFHQTTINIYISCWYSIRCS